jgi:hypothetical protein
LYCNAKATIAERLEQAGALGHPGRQDHQLARPPTISRYGRPAPLNMNTPSPLPLSIRWIECGTRR